MCRRASARPIPGSELATKPLLALFERSGVTIDRASQRISAVLATPETARALKVRVGSPLIELVRVVYDRNGRGVEHLHALYRPDRYNLEMELVRSGKGDAGNLGAGRRRQKSWQSSQQRQDQRGNCLTREQSSW